MQHLMCCSGVGEGHNRTGQFRTESVSWLHSCCLRSGAATVNLGHSRATRWGHARAREEDQAVQNGLNQNFPGERWVQDELPSVPSLPARAGTRRAIRAVGTRGTAAGCRGRSGQLQRRASAPVGVEIEKRREPSRVDRLVAVEVEREARAAAVVRLRHSATERKPPPTI